MLYDWFAFLLGAFAGGLLVWFYWRLRMRTLWYLLSEYYYSEHLYPLVKRGTDITHYRLAWESFRHRFLGR